MVSQFKLSMELMRKHDPQLQEDGYWSLLPVAGEHIDELIAEYSAEAENLGLKRWLLDLIGSAQDPRALPLFESELNSADESIRDNAVRGLETLNTKPAREVLYRWRANAPG